MFSLCSRVLWAWERVEGKGDLPYCTDRTCGPVEKSAASTSDSVGGAGWPRSGIDAQAEDALGTYDTGGRTYTFDEVGVLEGEIEFSSPARYFGIGWGNKVGWDKTRGLVVDVGVMYQGAPSVSLTTERALPPEGQEQLEDEYEGYAVWPVLSIGLSYKF